VRVLFTTTGHSGHLLPLVPFARALQRAGHDVRVATQRSRVDAVERRGLAAWPLAEASEAAWAPVMGRLPALLQPDADVVIVRDGFVGLGAGTALPDVLAIVESWQPDLVVRESYELAGAIAAELYRIPHALVALGLASTEDWVRGLAAGSVAKLRSEVGLSPDRDGERLRHVPVLTSAPAAFDDGPAHRFRDAEPMPALPLPDWWANADDPLVYVTLGSVAGSMSFFPELYRSVLAALAPLPVRVLLTLGTDADPADLGQLPANAHVEPWLPQEAILPNAAAVVCHGGFGTTLGALAHGVPLVVLPLFAGDQWRTARRVAQVGAGIELANGPRRVFEAPGPELMAALPGAVRRVLDDSSYAAVARRLGDEMAQLAPVDDAVDLLAGATGSAVAPGLRQGS
jgi:UDP-N-acetylglucosamine:LPS N-acetylglucosamine transferase